MASLLSSLTGSSVPDLKPPTLVSAGRDTLTVQWDPVEGAKGYKLRQAQSGLMTSWADVPLNQVDGTTCTVTGLDPETAYVVQLGVAVGDAAGTIEYSASSELMTTLSEDEATRKETVAELLATKAALAKAHTTNAELQGVVAERERQVKATELQAQGLRDEIAAVNARLADAAATIEAHKAAEAEALEQLAAAKRDLQADHDAREELERTGASMDTLRARVVELEAHNRRLAAQCGINSTVSPQPRRRRSSVADNEEVPGSSSPPVDADANAGAGAGEGSAGDPMEDVPSPGLFEQHRTAILMAAASTATALLSVAVHWMMED